MRKAMAVIAACLLLAGCSDSTSSEDPSAGETPTPSANETTTGTTPSPEGPIPSSSTSAEPTAELSVDFMNQPLAGLPDCDWRDLTFKPNGEGDAIHLRDLGENEQETTYIALNETGRKCVIREVPDVTFFDSDNQIMDPTFGPSELDHPLPWVLPETSAVNFYFGRIRPGDMCPQTGEYIHHIDLTFDNGEVLTIPQINKYYACPQQEPPYELTMHVNLIQ